MSTSDNYRHDAVLEADEFFDPVEPQPDWLTDSDLDKIEAELGLLKEGTDIKKKRELEEQLVSGFKKAPTKETFMPLYTSYKPLIISAARKNMMGSPLPQAVHMAFAAQSFMDAARTFNPTKGASFRTHVYNTVQEKGKRLNLKYQNIGYIPESRATKYQAYQTALHLMREELGREPSSIELADELNLPVTEIEKLRKEVKKDLIGKEHIITQGLGFAQSDKALQVMRDIQYSLEPKHQLVLEYTVGLNGKTPLVKKSGKSDIAAIAKAAGIGLNEVRSARKTIKRKVQEYRSFIGQGDRSADLFDESNEE